MSAFSWFRRERPALRAKNVTLRLPARGDYREWAALREASRSFLEPWEPRWAPDELLAAQLYTAPDELVRAVREVIAGRRYMTPALAAQIASALSSDPDKAPHEALSDRELQVLRMMAMGKTVREIAKELGLSDKTISTYRTRVLEKLELRTTAEMMRYAIKAQLVD